MGPVPETDTQTLSPTRVAQLIHRVSRPHMGMDNWCLNAARIAQDVLKEHGIKSWAVQCTVAHMNKAYVEIADRHGFLLGDGEAEARWSEELQEVGAWMCFASVDDARAIPNSFPGHVLTWVPGWSCYLDPSADQFNRPAKNILLEPEAWQADPPPAQCAYKRDDGGVSVILPQPGKAFKNAGGYRRPSPPHIVAEILKEWPV